MISYPFDSNLTGYDEAGLPQFDRTIDAEEFRNWTSMFYTNGVRANSNDFVVSAGTGMNVVVNPGSGNVQGVIFRETEERTLAIETAHATNDRIDTIVLRLDEIARTVDLYVKTGTPSTNPVRPTLTRPAAGESGDVYELGIADIRVAKASTNIIASMISDTRLETERCGVIVGALVTLDTNSYYNQFQAALNEYLGIVDAAIDGTLAGNLQNQINMIGNAIQANLILTSGGWAEQKQTKTMTVEGGVDTVLLGAPSTITQEQLEGWSGIIISDADYTGTTLTVTFTALLDTPSIDIPVAVTVTRTGG